MTTPDSVRLRPGGGIPVEPAELAALAQQLWSESNPTAIGGPAAPVAPRGSAPFSAGGAHTIAPSADPSPLDAPRGAAPFGTVLDLPGPDTPPYTVPVAPRGSAPGSGAAQAPASFGAPLPSLGSISAPTTSPVAPSPASPGTSVPGVLPTTTPPGGPAIGLALPTVWLRDTPAQPPSVAAALAPWTTPAFGAPSADYASLPSTQSLPGLAPDALASVGSGVPRLDNAPAEAFDVASIRADFPILSEQINGHQLIWFDNAATTQKPQAVIDRLSSFYTHENSNIHRAAHTLAARATDAYEDARDTVRDFLGAAKSSEIIFVRGATEAINLVAQSWGRHNLRPGDEILLTQLEHHANIVPWQIIARATGAIIKVAPVDNAGNLLLTEFAELLGPRTKLVAATAVANAIGTVTPITEIVALAHRAGARVLIDGAQSVPHLRTNVGELGADFFVFSGHKVFGPTGIGALYIAEDAWEETPAWQGGGNMIADVTIERSIYQPPPNKYEAGTGNIADAVGLAAALRYVRKVGIERIAAYEAALLDYATPRLAEIAGVRLIGTADHKASVLSFVLAGHQPENVGAALNQRGIAVRAGHHCAQPILRRLGVEKTVRPSFAFYNTTAEIDVFLQAVADLSDRE